MYQHRTTSNCQTDVSRHSFKNIWIQQEYKLGDRVNEGMREGKASATHGHHLSSRNRWTPEEVGNSHLLHSCSLTLSQQVHLSHVIAMPLGTRPILLIDAFCRCLEFRLHICLKRAHYLTYPKIIVSAICHFTAEGKGKKVKVSGTILEGRATSASSNVCLSRDDQWLFRDHLLNPPGRSRRAESSRPRPG